MGEQVRKKQTNWKYSEAPTGSFTSKVNPALGIFLSFQLLKHYTHKLFLIKMLQLTRRFLDLNHARNNFQNNFQNRVWEVILLGTTLQHGSSDIYTELTAVVSQLIVTGI